MRSDWSAPRRSRAPARRELTLHLPNHALAARIRCKTIFVKAELLYYDKEAIKECVRLGVLAEYLTTHGSEVANMVFGEWNLDDALAVREQETREDERELWQSIMADKDAEIAAATTIMANKDAEIAALKEQLKRVSPRPQ